MDTLIIPLTSFDILKKVIRAFRIAHSDSGIDIKELILKTGCKRDSVYRNIPFLEIIELLTSNEDMYILTEIGKQYADLLEDDQNEQANEVLKNALQNHEPFEFIVNYVKLERKVSPEDLRKRIEDLINVGEVKKEHKAGINCIIEILTEIQLVGKENSYFIPI